jgi:prepilin-type N-terminal cleavage/methylation domain-containing protein/prepilin-type processing-associated H-X9-DG protein
MVESLMKAKDGFSLIELLVVISTVSILMAVLMPAITGARQQARAVTCRSNLRQLVLANIEYSNDNDGFFVPAAEDLWFSFPGTTQAGYYRWHGKRNGPNEQFDPLKGLLAYYLGDGKIKECPQRVDFTKDQAGDINFELGCGGYGYNMAYIGSRLAMPGAMNPNLRYAQTIRVAEIKKPDATLMFADTAFYQKDNQNNWYLIEYSFAEPPFVVSGGRIYERSNPSPSIHFRHRGMTNVGWADGHIEPRKMAKIPTRQGYTAEMVGKNMGWFEPVDNTPFDLK